ncbi:MAG: IF-2-associated domain-containing protein, partial [Alphaproteobacteria bacterium]|nr:IF-2-associated domain-containing protein [Alphaproteobacteria bacterium]
MTNSNDQDQDRKAPLRLTQPGRLELKKTVETGQVRQSFSHGRSKVVTVEVRKKRTFTPAPVADNMPDTTGVEGGSRGHIAPSDLTRGEKANRARVLQDALRADEESRRQAALRAEEDARRRAEDDARRAEEEARR